MASNVRINTTSVSLSSYDVSASASVTLTVVTAAQELTYDIQALLEFPYYTTSSGSAISSMVENWSTSTTYSISSVIVNVNGTNYSLTKNASGAWVKTFTAPSTTSYAQTDHKYGLTVTITCSDGQTKTITRSDSTFGSYLQLRVREKTLPTVTPTAPTAGSYSTSSSVTCKCTVSDSGSGMTSSNIRFYLDGSLKTGWSYSGNVVTYSATGLSNGSHSFYVVATDNDGNTRTGATRQFYVDTVNPVLTISSPEDGSVVRTSSMTVSGTATDVTAGINSVTVNGTAVTVGSGGAFSTTVSLSSGVNTITIIATDKAGRTTTVTRTVTYTNTRPVITSIGLVPNPVNVATAYIITAVVDEETI